MIDHHLIKMMKSYSGRLENQLFTSPEPAMAVSVLSGSR
jgi:hypothetical protein